jgi:hypothetical protein
MTYRDGLKSFKAIIKATDLQGLPGNRRPKSGDTYLGLGLEISTEKGINFLQDGKFNRFFDQIALM